MRFLRFLVLSFMLLLVAGVMQGQDTPYPLLMAQTRACGSDPAYFDVVAYDIFQNHCYRVWSDVSPDTHDYFPNLAIDPSGKYIAFSEAYWNDIYVVQIDDEGIVKTGAESDVLIIVAWGQLKVSTPVYLAWSSVIHGNEASLAYTRLYSEKDCLSLSCMSTDIAIKQIPLRTWTSQDFVVVKQSTHGITALEQEVNQSYQRFTHNDFNEYELAWSPDGQQLAVVSDINMNGDLEIYVLDKTLGENYKITDSVGENRFPTWSPNGEWIAFSSTRSGRLDHDIYKINLKTGEIIQLTNSWTDDLYPAWSPDGEYIAFQAGSMITVMKPNGTDVDVLFEGGQPSWVANPEWVMRAPQVILSSDDEDN
jgi:tricorn protease-like protein